MSRDIDLQAAEYGHIDMPAADQAERHRAVEDGCAGQGTDRFSAGVGQQRMGQALFRDWPGADQSVLRLKEHLEAGGDIIRYQSGNAYAQIDEISGFEFLRHAPGDDDLGIHASLIRDQIIDKRRRRDDMVGRDDADWNDIVRGDDDGVGGHCHDWIKISRSERVRQIAGIVGEEGMN